MSSTFATLPTCCFKSALEPIRVVSQICVAEVSVDFVSPASRGPSLRSGPARGRRYKQTARHFRQQHKLEQLLRLLALVPLCLILLLLSSHEIVDGTVLPAWRFCVG